MVYLISNSIQNSNNTRKTTTNRNTNNACQGNTEHNKKDIKRQENYTKPALEKPYNLLVITNMNNIRTKKKSMLNTPV